MNARIATDLGPGLHDGPPPSRSEGDRCLAPVQQFTWQSRFGPMLIEVRADAIYVNGQRVEQAPPGF